MTRTERLEALVSEPTREHLRSQMVRQEEPALYQTTPTRTYTVRRRYPQDGETGLTSYAVGLALGEAARAGSRLQRNGAEVRIFPDGDPESLGMSVLNAWMLLNEEV